MRMFIDDLSEDAREKYLRLMRDPVYFYDILLQREDEELFDYQKQLMRDVALRPMLNNPIYREYIVLKGRQIGISWMSGILALWAGATNKEWEIICLSFNLEQAQRILNYTKSFAERLKDVGLYKELIAGQSATNLRFTTKSIVTSVGCTRPTAHNVRNYHAHLLFIDEATLIYDKMFPAISPLTSQTGGKTLYISTAGVIGTVFHRLWQDGNTAEKMRQTYIDEFKNAKLQGLSDWEAKNLAEEKIGRTWDEILKIKSYTLPSYICPKLSEKDLQNEKRKLGEVRFRREFECVWSGTSDQIFTLIPMYNLRNPVTKTRRPCYAGIDVGKVNDPTVLVVIEEYQNYMDIDIDGVTKPVFVPYRVIYIKEWNRERMISIANYIKTNIIGRYNIRLFAIDATGGHGDELLNRMIELEMPCKALKVKSKTKNELMIGGDGLEEAFMSQNLWINSNPNDLASEELRFELGGYIGEIMGNGLYKFDSTVGRDHYVDALAYAWNAVKSATFEPVVFIRKPDRFK